MKLVPASLERADLQADAAMQAGEAAGGASPAVTYKHPFAGYLTAQSLHAAYSLPTETASSSLQTIAVIDAYDDPTAEADLAVYDETFGLPPCTDRQRLLSQDRPGRPTRARFRARKANGQRRYRSTCRWRTPSARAAACCWSRPTTKNSSTSVRPSMRL